MRESQLRRLAEIRATRDQRAVDEALAALTGAAEAGSGNLLELAVRAARVRATLGEISTALEKVFGRYQAVNRTISGVYSAESQDNPEFQAGAARWPRSSRALEGRRPRILMAKMGQDGHDRGAKVIATAFADLGFDVDVGPLFQTPREAARMAVENDVHVLGVSSLAGGHSTLVPEVIAELKKLGREDILVLVGGVIPPQDYEALFQAGVTDVFGPGSVIPVCAQKILTRADRECACRLVRAVGRRKRLPHVGTGACAPVNLQAASVQARCARCVAEPAASSAGAVCRRGAGRATAWSSPAPSR